MEKLSHYFSNLTGRMTSGWTFIRVIYIALGIYIVSESVMNKEWMAAVFGGYFAAMGLFAIGCAGGSCYTGNSSNHPVSNKEGQEKPVVFEEIKNK